MRTLKRLLTSSEYIPANELVEQYLNVIRLSSSSQLPVDYNSVMGEMLKKCQKLPLFLYELLQYFKKYSHHQNIIKLITITHCFVVEMKYNKDCIAHLQELNMHVFEKRVDEKWLTEFYQSYVTYLIKLPSLSDIYSEALSKEHNVKPALHLTHIFRVTNTIRLLFPATTNAINIIGRYQASKYTSMKELFVILSGQLVKIYCYVKYLCDQILRQYRVYSTNDLECFVQTLPQLELICDKMEDLLSNKYLKGKKIHSKIQFKEEKVLELQYYLKYEYTADTQKQNVGLHE